MTIKKNNFFPKFSHIVKKGLMHLLTDISIDIIKMYNQYSYENYQVCKKNKTNQTLKLCAVGSTHHV